MREGWLYFTAALLVLYVGQTFPHDHSVSGHAGDHTGHHDTPIPHAHDSHSHDHDADKDTGDPWQTHHHLARHVDPHFLITSSQGLDPNPDLTSEVSQLHLSDDDEPLRTKWSDVDIWIPEPIPILPLDSRAPPMRG